MTQQQEQAMATLTGHVMELRKRILWSFLAMVFGTVLCFFFKEQIFSFLGRLIFLKAWLECREITRNTVK